MKTWSKGKTKIYEDTHQIRMAWMGLRGGLMRWTQLSRNALPGQQLTKNLTFARSQANDR